MKAAFRTLLVLGIVAAAVMVARAEEKKDEKKTDLKGEIGCPKCVFGHREEVRQRHQGQGRRQGSHLLFLDKGNKELPREDLHRLRRAA